MKTVYQCSYCGELFKHAYQCMDHEAICEMNPENKTCKTCKYFSNGFPKDSCYVNENYSALLKSCDKYEEKENK